MRFIYTFFFIGLFSTVCRATDDHLLLCEAVLTPTVNEFIEIYNPTAMVINLDNYYLSDDEDYSFLPGISGAGPTPNIGTSDFIVQFPPGSTIAPNQTIVIAFDAAGFIVAFGSNPDFDIKGTEAGTPDMNAITAVASSGLTNGGENISLFYWDGTSDLIQDVDMVNLGTPSSTNDIGDKSGVSVDGPDADVITSTYNNDSNTIPQQIADPSSGFSTKRLYFETNSEILGGNGLTGDDETSEDISITWDSIFTVPNPGICSPTLLPPNITINEVDADTSGIDALEFVELFGDPNTALDGLTVVFYNGSDDASYLAFDLDGFSTDANGFFVLGNAAVANVSMVFPNDSLQNGVDAVALYQDDAINFPNDTSVTNVGIIDALVYDTDDGDDNVLINTLTPGQAQINERGAGDGAAHSNSRVPDGGSLLDTSTYVQQTPTPGQSNITVLPPNITINEVDADTLGTDLLEFVELFGDPNTALDGLTIVFYNGSDDASYDSYDLDGFSTDSNGFFVIGNAGVANVSLVFANPDNNIQNGADAVALIQGDAINFPNDTPVTNVGLIDAIVYDTGDGDDSGLIDVLTPAQAQIDEHGGGNGTGHSNSRVPDGGMPLDTSTYVQQDPTPGETNVLPSIIINEIHADPDGTLGDANGDGTRHGSDDEFVELVNISGADLDVSGWTLSDGFSARHVFPAGSIIPDQCSLVVFGGGTPTGTFGDSLVQVASTGSVGLNNGGDSITVNNGTFDVTTLSYGGEGNNNQSITRDPDITGGTPLTLHTIATGSGGSLFSPGTLVDGSNFSGCIGPPPVVTIYEIQGSGDVSPYDGLVVATNDNIVTAVGPEGFTIQSPDASADADPQTSEGIYVFTSSAPTVAVGDQVDITGEVEEYFGFTQITNNPMISLDSNGNPLPTPIILDANTPSPIPGSPSCAAGVMECFESMLVQMSGITVGPSQSFGGDPIAEAKVVVGTNRTFREPGIEFPGMPGLPVWDGNPEIFEIDPDRLGLPNQIFTSGVQFNATGVIGYEFGDYELWPTNYSINAVPTIPLPVRAPVTGEMTIASLNLFRLFNDIDDPAVNGRDDAVVSTAEYAIRRAKFVNYIRDVLGNPDILAVQEAESLVVLNDLAADIFNDSGITYTAQLIEGNDIGTIDVGFLLKDTINLTALTQLGAAETHSFDGSLLHDRPPLLLEASYTGNGMPFDVGVFVVHTLSFNGIDDIADGDRVRSKRQQQSQSIATMAQNFQTTNPNIPMLVVGDFNAYEFSDGYVDVVGQIQGVLDPLGTLVPAVLITNPPLTNQVLTVPTNQRYSFNFRGNAQVLDHALTSTYADIWVRGFEFGVGNSDVIRTEIDNTSSSVHASDHDGLVLFMMTDFDADLIPDDIDNCPVDANNDQSDVDMDGIGDVCDSCDDSGLSVFSVTAQTINQISGTVEQCGGINSVALDVDVINMSLATSGNPTDTLWTFTLDLIDPTVDGSTSLVATGSINSTTSTLYSLIGDFDADLIPDDVDNCPVDANNNQSDIDMDGIGDVCDTCDASAMPVFSVTSQNNTQISGNVEQCQGINSLVLDPGSINVSLSTTGNPGDTLWTFDIGLTNPAIDGSTTLTAQGTINPSTSMLFSLIGDFDADMIPDNIDNCPVNANTNQSDIDMDGIGDVCDSCDASSASVFTITGRSSTQLFGTIEQCAGINSVVFGGNTNLSLITTGNPGDPLWTFTLEHINPLFNGSATLVAQGMVSTTTSMLFSLLGLTPAIIPALNITGILSMLLLMLISGLWFRFSRYKH